MTRRIVLSVLAVTLGASLAWAEFSTQGGRIVDGQPIKTVTVTSNTNSAGSFGAQSEIVGFKLNATSDNAHCALFDAATVTGTAIEELTEASADESSVHIWPNPYRLTTDLSIAVANGNCIVYYF